MDSISDKVSRIELKIRQLALKIERLENDNKSLLEENRLLKAELSKGGSKSSNLEVKLADAQKALVDKRESDPEDTKRLRKKINQYVVEIEKCIEWLNAN